MRLSPTLAMNNLMKERQQKGLPVYKFGFGQSPFPVPEIMVEELKRYAHVKDYLHTQGLLALRESIASYYHKQFDIQCSADQIIVGPGSKELLFLSQLALNRDLLLPRPSWVSYEPQAKLLGKQTVWVDCHAENAWKLQAEELKAVLEEQKSRLFTMVFNFPSNPSGASYSKEELESLANVCREYNVVVISDEIYAEFSFESKHTSFAKVYPEGTIVCNGLSKWCGAGGWRLGYLIVPKELEKIKSKILEAGSETYSCAAAPVQFAAIKAFENGKEIRTYTETCKQRLVGARDCILSTLDNSIVKMQRPVGGFYGLLEFNSENEKELTSVEFCQQLLNDTGVAVLHGGSFGFDEKKLVARLAYVDFDGIGALGDISDEELFARMRQGIELMNEWSSRLATSG